MRNRLSRKKLFVGVTGGIGSGKTLVCNYLEELGAKIFYADEIARSMYVTSKGLKSAVVKEFGNDTDRRNKIDFAGKTNSFK
jgi:dephospho-CoA kinase